MGWTTFNWRTPTELRKEYETDMARSGVVKTFGWCGSFLKCVHVPTNRPFLVDVMVSFFNKREGYGYKAISSTSGPGDTNMNAARWLRRELAKRGMSPERYEHDWLLYCERRAHRAKLLKSIKPGDVLTSVTEFDLTFNTYHFDAGDQFTVTAVRRGHILCTPKGKSWPYMKLSSDIFLENRPLWKDYPLMVV